MRIVSLLPSATDLICSLGLGENLVGRTHECDWPPGIEHVPVMTRDVLATAEMRSGEIDRAIGASVHSGSSIYALDREALRAAVPDLIVTQELCDVCAVGYTEVVEAARLMDAGARVVSLEPRGIDDVLGHVSLLGSLTGAEERARALVGDLRARVERLRDLAREVDPAPAVCVEWLDPIYAAGHWVPEQVALAGGRELLGEAGAPSRPVAWEAVVEAQPEALFLMPCGFPLSRTRAELEVLRERPGWDRLPAVRAGRVWSVDGSSYFNRPGPRLVRGAEILAGLLHPGFVDPPAAHEAERVP